MINHAEHDNESFKAVDIQGFHEVISSLITAFNSGDIYAFINYLTESMKVHIYVLTSAVYFRVLHESYHRAIILIYYDQFSDVTHMIKKFFESYSFLHC